jgi:hypothetical protein
MTFVDGAWLRRPLDLLQQVYFGQVTKGGGLHRPEPLYFNSRFGDCFRNY